MAGSAAAEPDLPPVPATQGARRERGYWAGDARPLVVAIIGAGPSGIYAAEALSQQTDVAVEVAVIDRLPVPFGLVRYGVAPDHHSIRSIRNTLERTLERSGVASTAT